MKRIIEMVKQDWLFVLCAIIVRMIVPAIVAILTVTIVLSQTGQ